MGATLALLKEASTPVGEDVVPLQSVSPEYWHLPFGPKLGEGLNVPGKRARSALIRAPHGWLCAPQSRLIAPGKAQLALSPA